MLLHQQLLHFDCGGCSITSDSSSPGLGLPRRPGNIARSTAISILFMTRSSSISTARDTLWPVAALVSKYNKLLGEVIVNADYKRYGRQQSHPISRCYLSSVLEEVRHIVIKFCWGKWHSDRLKPKNYRMNVPELTHSAIRHYKVQWRNVYKEKELTV